VGQSDLMSDLEVLAAGDPRFGPMAKTVFESWGVSTTEDFGEIVFKLIEAGVLGKTDKDSREDFSDVFDFNDVFERQYDWNIEGAL